MWFLLFFSIFPPVSTLLSFLLSESSLKYFLGPSLVLIILIKAYFCAQRVKSKNVSLKFYVTIWTGKWGLRGLEFYLNTVHIEYHTRGGGGAANKLNSYV